MRVAVADSGALEKFILKQLTPPPGIKKYALALHLNRFVTQQHCLCRLYECVTRHLMCGFMSREQLRHSELQQRHGAKRWRQIAMWHIAQQCVVRRIGSSALVGACWTQQAVGTTVVVLLAW